MDFTLIRKIENGEGCYKLLRANFYRDYYVIIVQNKREFACGSVNMRQCEAEKLLCEMCESLTEPHTLMDILCDMQKQKI